MNSRSRVYAAACGDLVKIGKSQNIPIRLYTLSRQMKSPVHLIGSIPGSYHEEAMLHWLLRNDRVSGEWFRRSPQVEAFLSIAKKGECPSWLRRIHGFREIRDFRTIAVFVFGSKEAALEAMGATWEDWANGAKFETRLPIAIAIKNGTIPKELLPSQLPQGLSAHIKEMNYA